MLTRAHEPASRRHLCACCRRGSSVQQNAARHHHHRSSCGRRVVGPTRALAQDGAGGEDARRRTLQRRLDAEVRRAMKMRKTAFVVAAAPLSGAARRCAALLRAVC
jgi:hypothetical protein